MNGFLRRFGTLGLSAFFVIGPLGAWYYRQSIFDWSRLRGYEPSAVVAKLATDTTMNESTRRLFYVYRPSLEPKETFNKHCTDSEHTIVLGCYVTNTGIYIYDINDLRLAGIEEVTAAHELLHAAYDRLSSKEKQRINHLVQAAYAQVDDARIKRTVDQYRQRDPGVVPNELHSILGTEVASLPAELEAYYKRYFNNRAKIVALSRQYVSAFDDRRNQVAAADAALKNLKSQIDTLEASLKSQYQELIAERKRMDTLLDNRQVDAYNNTVPVYNQKVAAYNNDVATQRRLIEEYNGIVKQRNSLVLEENELIKAIDSRPDAPTLQ